MFIFVERFNRGNHLETVVAFSKRNRRLLNRTIERTQFT